MRVCYLATLAYVGLFSAEGRLGDGKTYYRGYERDPNCWAAISFNKLETPFPPRDSFAFTKHTDYAEYAITFPANTMNWPEAEAFLQHRQCQTDGNMVYPFKWLSSDSMVTNWHEDLKAWENHQDKLELKNSVRYRVLAHVPADMSYGRLKSVLHNHYYKNPDWIKTAVNCVATREGVSFLDIHCLLVNFLLQKGQTDKQIEPRLLDAAVEHLKENRGKGTESDEENDSFNKARWQLTGAQIKIARQDGETSIVEADGELNGVTHFGIFCSKDYRQLLEHTSDLSEYISLAEESESSGEAHACNSNGLCVAEVGPLRLDQLENFGLFCRKEHGDKKPADASTQSIRGPGL